LLGRGDGAINPGPDGEGARRLQHLIFRGETGSVIARINWGLKLQERRNGGKKKKREYEGEIAERQTC